jgi:hypothetical protein
VYLASVVVLDLVFNCRVEMSLPAFPLVMYAPTRPVDDELGYVAVAFLTFVTTNYQRLPALMGFFRDFGDVIQKDSDVCTTMRWTAALDLTQVSLFNGRTFVVFLALYALHMRTYTHAHAHTHTHTYTRTQVYSMHCPINLVKQQRSMGMCTLPS